MTAFARGQGLVEYGLILAITAVLTTVWLVVFGGTVSDALTAIGIAIDRATGGLKGVPVRSDDLRYHRLSIRAWGAYIYWRSPRSEGEYSSRRHLRMALFNSFLATLRRDEEGQGLAEYALILALIAIIAIIALIFLGNQVSTILSTVGSSV